MLKPPSSLLSLHSSLLLSLLLEAINDSAGKAETVLQLGIEAGQEIFRSEPQTDAGGQIVFDDCGAADGEC